MLDQINKECNRSGFNLGESTVNDIASYVKELMAWNQKVNLTAVKNEREIFARLVVPALSFSVMLPLEKGSKVLDFGSGAGFPGIPLKIAFPCQDITLVDSIGKKVKFLMHVAKRLDLRGLRCINDRGEALVKRDGERGQYDFVVVMAVSDLFTLKKYGFPFLKRGGKLVTLKGERLPFEIEELRKKSKKSHEYRISEIKDFSPQNCTPYKLISIEKL